MVVELTAAHRPKTFSDLLNRCAVTLRGSRFDPERVMKGLNGSARVIPGSAKVTKDSARVITGFCEGDEIIRVDVLL